MNLSPDEERELLATLTAELREAEAALAEASVEARERAERRVRILRRATSNVALRVKRMEPGWLGDVAHSDVVAAARAFAEAQLGALGDREIVARIVLAAESRLFLFERSGEAYIEVGGIKVASPDAMHALLLAAAGFLTTAMRALDEGKRRAIGRSLQEGAMLGVDVALRSGVVTLQVGRGDQSVIVAIVAPSNAAAEALH